MYKSVKIHWSQKQQRYQTRSQVIKIKSKSVNIKNKLKSWATDRSHGIAYTKSRPKSNENQDVMTKEFEQFKNHQAVDNKETDQVTVQNRVNWKSQRNHQHPNEIKWPKHNVEKIRRTQIKEIESIYIPTNHHRHWAIKFEDKKKK